MTSELSYHDIAQKIDRGEDFSNLTPLEIHEIKHLISRRLKDVENDKESLAITKIHLLIFLVRIKSMHREDEVMKMYEEIRRNFFEEEKKYNQRWDKTVDKVDRSIIYNQMIYFYKIAEFHFAYLEKVFKKVDFHECMLESYQDRLHFLRRRQLLEGNVKKFLLYTRMSFSAFLKEYKFIYGFFSVAGVVLIWQGLWGIYDWVFAYFDVTESLLAYFGSVFIGILILSFLGIFLNQTIGNKDILKGDSADEEVRAEDLKKTNEIVNKKITE